jgi:hypothetical protein
LQSARTIVHSSTNTIQAAIVKDGSIRCDTVDDVQRHLERILPGRCVEVTAAAAEACGAGAGAGAGNTLEVLIAYA